MKKCLLMVVFCGMIIRLFSQTSAAPQIPSVLDGVSYNSSGKLVLTKAGNAEDMQKKDVYLLSKMVASPTGAETGIMVDIGLPHFNGIVAYGPLNESAAYPTVAFLPKDVKMVDGRALLEIKKVFVRSNDFFKLGESGKGVLGYRVIDSSGRVIYEGRVAFEGKGQYQVVPTIIEGPMVTIELQWDYDLV